MYNEPTLSERFTKEVDLKGLIDQLTIGICVFDVNGHSLYANAHFQTMFGYTMEELQFKHLYELFVREDAELILKEGMLKHTKQSFDHQHQMRGLRKDNSVVDIQILSLTKQSDSKVILELIDTTRHKPYESQFSQKEIESLFQALDDSTTVSITDSKGIILYVNDKFCEISKFEKRDLIGQNHRIIKSSYHSEELFQEMWSTISTGKMWKGEVCNKCKDGTLWWGDAIIVPILDKNRKSYQYISIRSDITKRKKTESEIYKLAFYDQLTDLPNRKLFENQLDQEIKLAREWKTKFTLMIIELHGLKHVNDSIGTALGDKLLQEVSRCLNGLVQKKGRLFRIDGDEFAVIFPNLFEEQYIKAIANEIINLFKQSFCIDEYELFLTASAGLSIFPDSGESTHPLMKKTYFALQQSKGKGESNYQLFLTKKSERIYKQFILKNGLQEALERKEFFLVYQPKIETKTNKIIGAEALMRWNHPELGVVSPYEFIPLAEEDGFITSLGEMGLLEACRQNKQWQDQGFPPIRISVNFSVIQFMQMDMIHKVEQILKNTGLEPKWLEIELTESALIKDEIMVSSRMEQLKELGVSTAIDDFGTGYASLSYLKNLKANTIKIDKSFIKGLPHESESALIVSMIIQLAKKLNINTVAEGVETLEQLNLLNHVNCDEIQGYLYSKPVDIKTFESLLKQEVCLPK
ncbi:EAL domain-containing protein [Niallia oryzisoli]|uniref:EAL domain-containing protein n=1 Tax=Niallia oryzisoli TaxID=1737571 RepID=UPI00373558A4